jgi:asparagine synthase (glutamine-hydrolysing)
MEKFEVMDLFTDQFKKKLNNFDPSNLLINTLSNIDCKEDYLNKLLFLEMKYFLTDHNLNYTDKMSMAVGVEVRVPFLDKELVEFSTLIPVEFKMRGVNTKYILKKVAEKYLPNDVIYRPKSGFGAPVRDWIINDLKDSINVRLSKERIDKRGIFNYENVRKLVERNSSDKIDASYSIWALLSIESWLTQFYDFKNNV